MAYQWPDGMSRIKLSHQSLIVLNDISSTKLFILSLFGWMIFKMMYATESCALMIDIHIIMLSPPR